MKPIPDDKYGFIFPRLRRVHAALEYVSVDTLVGGLREKHRTPTEAQARAWKIDFLVLACWAIDVGLVLLGIQAFKSAPTPSPLALLAIWVLGGYRLFLILHSNLGIVLFGSSDTISSPRRVVLLMLFNYVEMVVLWTCFYLAAGPESVKGEGSWRSIPYMSAITQTTVGFGDVTPVGWARGLAIAQAIAGTLFLILMLGTLISVLPRLRAADEGESNPSGHNA